ncbi:hypothetical protein [Anabaena azotica]|uniref:Uncharacterized protein n=1 Tax=Anabaena azotica FACHB-119 TaxID=947527 RepID=A0ABR8DDD1_9NOST|nr:hypothetical protein [Anabaena azotica]MBD2505240.1 hypothetical protein [Anabaena azotica FACHB-119]
MLSLILSIVALISASTGALASARAIGNMYEPEEMFKKITNFYENAFNELENNLKYTNKLVEKHSQIRHETLSNIKDIETIIQVLKEIITQDKQNILKYEFLSQNLEENANILNNIKSYMSKNTSVDSYYADNNLVNPIKIALQNLSSQYLDIQKIGNTTINSLRKYSISIHTGGIIIGTLLSLGNIAVSPAVIIAGFFLNRQLGKAFIKVKEYESEVDSAIFQINSARQLVKNVQQKISDSIINLQSYNELITQLVLDYNQQIYNYQKAENIQKLVNMADQGATALQPFCSPQIGATAKFITTILKMIPLASLFKLPTLNLIKISSFTQKRYERLFLVGLEEITKIKLERELLDLNSLSLQPKVEKTFVHYLRWWQERSHQGTINS